MKMVSAFAEQNVEDHGSIIRKLERCLCIDLKAKEESSYEVFLLEKQTKMSFQMVQNLSHTSDLPHMHIMRLK